MRLNDTKSLSADIQVAYKVPDDTWADLVKDRVLTGRDLDPEGLAVLSNDCAVLGDELMTSILNVNPTTGEVLSPFVRTPDIDSEGQFLPGKFLSTVSDKVHCELATLKEDADECLEVPSEVVSANGYREHHKSGGYEGFAALPDGSVAAFLEKPLAGEPGIRVYDVDPGTCGQGIAPVFRSFRGFYQFEKNAVSIADVSAVPGSSRYVLVSERNNYPGLLSPAEFPQYGEGHQFPSPGLRQQSLLGGLRGTRQGSRDDQQEVHPEPSRRLRSMGRGRRRHRTDRTDSGHHGADNCH